MATLVPMKRIGWIWLFFALTSALANAQAKTEAYHITVYTGYSDGRKLLLEGRITKARPQPVVSATDNARKNLKHNLRQFFNKEGEGWPVEFWAGGVHFQARTDGEGYFRVEEEIPGGLPVGWQTVLARTVVSPGGKVKPAFGRGRILTIPPENTRGLISDIDDTILISEVLSKRRLLKNTFLKNPAQRRAVEGVAKLYTEVASSNPKPEAAPLFYLSGSPRQLYGGLTQFLQRNHFPKGVLLTKRISLDSASDAWLNQVAYKTKKIQEIFEYFPHVCFILVGDDGEGDPEVYEGVRKRYPQRVEAIWIRRVHPGVGRVRFENQLDLAEVLRGPGGGVVPE
ncbi:MAG: DUF2183 domain-containing protein [Proteobacteria bacterium]|nr:DUF2183 domain-containing protein [Cystobacterineae bacterium]MCL2315235.1 DUF2183 domain-containing protein [Pseudomonadota bacterium]